MCLTQAILSGKSEQLLLCPPAGVRKTLLHYSSRQQLQHGTESPQTVRDLIPRSLKHIMWQFVQFFFSDNRGRVVFMCNGLVTITCVQMSFIYSVTFRILDLCSKWIGSPNVSDYLRQGKTTLIFFLTHFLSSVFSCM